MGSGMLMLSMMMDRRDSCVQIMNQSEGTSSLVCAPSFLQAARRGYREAAPRRLRGARNESEVRSSLCMRCRLLNRHLTRVSLHVLPQEFNNE